MKPNSRRQVAACTLLTVGLGLACERSEPSDPAEAATTPTMNTLLGCVAQTGEPGIFLLSVAEGRQAQADAPPGTALPGGSQPRGEAQRREDRAIGTQGAPGLGPDTTVKVETYQLAGSNAADLQAHVGHTEEVVVEPERLDAARAERSGDVSPELQIRSVRHVSDECEREEIPGR